MMAGYFSRLMASTGMTLSSPVHHEGGLASSGAAASVIEVDEFQAVTPAAIVTKPTEEPCAITQPCEGDETIDGSGEVTPPSEVFDMLKPETQAILINAEQRPKDKTVLEHQARSTPQTPSVTIDWAGAVVNPAFPVIVSTQETAPDEAPQRAEQAPGLTSVSEPHRGDDQAEIQSSPLLDKKEHTCLVAGVPDYLKEVREWVAATPEGIEQPERTVLQTEAAIDGQSQSRRVLRDADKALQRPDIVENTVSELSIGEISIVVEMPQASPPRKEPNPPGVAPRCDAPRSRLSRHYIRI